MRTREEIERVLAAIEDAVLKTNYLSKEHATEYAVLYNMRHLLMWVLDGGLSPAEWALVRIARHGTFSSSRVEREALEFRRKLEKILRLNRHEV
jgi:hypothetical protein